MSITLQGKNEEIILDDQVIASLKRIAQKALRRYRAKPLPEYGRDEARELMSLAAHIATA